MEGRWSRFEPHNLEIMRLARSKEFGAVIRVEANDVFVSGGGAWRLDPKLAGGSLMDLGIYCARRVVTAPARNRTP